MSLEQLKNKKIAVLMGGLSKERDISIKSGVAVLKALKDKGYKAIPIDVGKDVDFVLKKEKIELAFIALHGNFGEDGIIQGVLELLGIKYTGSGVMASAMAMDKGFTKDVIRARGIPTPDFCLLDSIGNIEEAREMRLPVIVKPVSEGSTIGITIVKESGDLESAIDKAFEYDRQVMVESYIEGREFTVSIMSGKALPVIEIRPKSGFYDFESKYSKGKTEFDVPANIDDSLANKMSTLSVDCYNSLDCSGVARVDLMVDKDSNPFVIETNTIPGMTELSLLPMAAGAVGISYEDLVEKILLETLN